MIAATVGALVASRRPAHPVGWLLLTMGLALSLSGVLSDHRWYGVVARPGTLPLAGSNASSCAGWPGERP